MTNEKRQNDNKPNKKHTHTLTNVKKPTNMKEIKTGRCVAAANSLRSYQDDSFGCCSIFVKPHMSALICLLINGSVSLHTHPFDFNDAQLSLFTGSRLSTGLDRLLLFVYKKKIDFSSEFTLKTVQNADWFVRLCHRHIIEVS